MHPRLAVPGESHLFNIFYPLLPLYGDLSDIRNQEQLIHDILSTFNVRNWSPPVESEQVLESICVCNFSGVVDAVMTSWARQHDKPRWGEKTPHHTFFWREILDCFPNCRFIHLVRDGRDVALSYIKAPFGPKTIYSAAQRWCKWLEQIEEMKKQVDPQMLHEVRYEDLLDDPRQTLTDLCDYLDEEFVPEMLSFYTNVTSVDVDRINELNLERPLIRDNAQKWKTRLTEKDLMVFESVAHGTLVRYGYFPFFRTAPELSKARAFYLSWIDTPPRKLFAMMKNRRGQLDEWNRLKIRLHLHFQKWLHSILRL